MLYSHASFHQHRLDPAAAPCQREVDAPLGQDHPLAPQAAALEQSEGGQRELLEGPRQLLMSSKESLATKREYLKAPTKPTVRSEWMDAPWTQPIDFRSG